MITEPNQLLSNLFNWVREKVLEGMTFNDIIKSDEYDNLKQKIKEWRENPNHGQFIPEKYQLDNEVNLIYSKDLIHHTCFLGDYNINYFIKKFEAIPEHLWGVGETIAPDGLTKDVFGHCGQPNGQLHLIAPEAVTLALMVQYHLGNLPNINDGQTNLRGKNPKERIINSLKFFRYEMDESKNKEFKEEQDTLEFPPQKE